MIPPELIGPISAFVSVIAALFTVFINRSKVDTERDKNDAEREAQWLVSYKEQAEELRSLRIRYNELTARESTYLDRIAKLEVQVELSERKIKRLLSAEGLSGGDGPV